MNVASVTLSVAKGLEGREAFHATTPDSSLSPADDGLAAQNDKTGKAIREATADEIAATPGFTRSLAEKVLEGI